MAPPTDSSNPIAGLSIEQLIKQQAQNFETLRRQVNSAQQSVQKGLNRPALEYRLQLIAQIWEMCVIVNTQIEALKDGPHAMLPYFVEQHFMNAEGYFLESNDGLRQHFEKWEKPASQQTSSGNDGHSTISQQRQTTPLPVICIPKFSGKVIEWATFRDYFTSLIVNNETLDNLQKFHFLKSYLEGEAASLLKNLPLTGESFVSAWDRLKNRYENPRVLVQAELKSLFAIAPMKNDSVYSLKAIRDVATERIAALENLGRFKMSTSATEGHQPDGVSDFLVYFLVQKLDANIRMAWELHVGGSTAFPHLSKLLAFIDSRICALEAVQRQSESKQNTTVVRSHVAATKNSCPFCNASHKLFECAEFKKKSIESRFQFVKDNRLCLNCMAPGHSMKQCKSSYSCSLCQLRHNSLLHFKKNNSSQKAIENSSFNTVKLDSQSDTATTLHTVPYDTDNVSVLLATAQILISANSGRSVKVRALLDQGSTRTFITEELANALKIHPVQANIPLVGLANVSAGTAKVLATIFIRPRTGKDPALATTAIILKTLTNYAPTISSKMLTRSYLQNLVLADDNLESDQPIHVIIGADLYGDLLLSGLRKGRPGEPIAQNTALGWIISGKVVRGAVEHRAPVYSNHAASEDDLSILLRKFWEVEDSSRANVLTPDEEKCESHFLRTYSRTPEGRYVVRLSFKSDPPINIGNSVNAAMKSLRSLWKKFDNSPEVFNQYREFMLDYERQGHMTQLSVEPSDGPQIVYFPHHPVIKESSATTKLRVVFNASAKTTNFTSLNDHLLQGPKLQTNLFEVIIQWRAFRFVYSSDITQMYRQIMIHEKDRDYQRILWSPSIHEKVKVYQLNTVTYGESLAPFLALRVIQQLVRDEGDAFPRASRVLSNQIYVDDCLFGADTREEISAIRSEFIALLSKGKFVLRKWASNSPDLLEDINPDNHGLALEKNLDEDSSLKVLGIVWVPATDHFKFKVQLDSSLPTTKRQILSVVARLYDPLGWVSSVVIVAKTLIQKLWLASVHWDDVVPQELLDDWSMFYRDLASLNELSIPRWTGQGSDVVDASLHGFSDASMLAYAAVVYLRLVYYSGRISTTIVAGRTKVAPLKTITIPKLELCSAHLLTQLVMSVKVAPEFAGMKVTHWTDATIVLAWLNKHPSHWQTFVSNRVAFIQSFAPPHLWKHVPSKDNPADLGSRGILASELVKSELWWHGPPWLSLPETEWPNDLASEPVVTREEARVRVHHVSSIGMWLDELTSRVSSWAKMLRIVALVLKFLFIRLKFSITSHKNKEQVSLSHFCCDSQLILIRFLQTRLFSKEILLLKDKKRPLAKSNPLTALNPFIDENGLLRMSGRLVNAPLEFDRRFPMILKDHPVLRSIIRFYHDKALHGGTQLTLTLIRQSFWILKSRQLVKSTIYKCLPCARIKAETREQLMAALPIQRVSRSSRPFLYVGIDYAGPIKIRLGKGRGHSSQTAYIAVFVCFAVRAVHLETVSDYTAEAFLAALKRFVSRRGLPHTIFSDNGTNFKGANRELAETFANVTKSPFIQSYLANDKICWEYIPPAAAHFGGLWESGVRSVKYHLKRVLRDRTPVFEELSTLLCQIEMCLNSRPLSPPTDDPEDLSVLTPGHFLIGGELKAVPSESLLQLKENRLSRWQLWQQLLESFWVQWSGDYLSSLQQRNKWRFTQDNLSKNQLVLIKSESLPPTKWPLGRILDVHAGKDGLTRVVTVRTASGVYTRPITKLALLPVKHEES